MATRRRKIRRTRRRSRQLSGTSDEHKARAESYFQQYKTLHSRFELNMGAKDCNRAFNDLLALAQAHNGLKDNERMYGRIPTDAKGIRTTDIPGHKDIRSAADDFKAHCTFKFTGVRIP